MRLKSYFASSVEVAMQQARRELGEEAMLLDSRPAPQHAQHLGSCEVVFALHEVPAGAAVQAAATAAANGAAKGTPPGAELRSGEESLRLKGDLGDLRREMERITECVAQSRAYSVALGSMLSDPDFAACYAELTAADFAPEVAQEILADCAKTPFPERESQRRVARLRTSVCDRIRAMVEVDPCFDGRDLCHKQKTIAFVGPAGAGKTSILSKVAARHGLASRKPMHMVALDGFRVASWEQLRTVAAILGSSFEHVESVGSLPRVIQEHQQRAWIWIDTPGAGPQEEDIVEEIAVNLRKLSGVVVYLVLSAAMKSSDLRLAVARFAPCEPDKVVFAHLDETEGYGGLFSVAAWLKKPIAFLSGGQRIPEDLEAATAETITGLLPWSARRNIFSQKAGLHAGRAAAGS